VCGTNYGAHYLEAIERNPRRYELAGILARGSLRSTLLAARYGVPLYQTVGTVPDGIDVAFAAMGVAGDEAVLQLLRRGVDVLCEHPVFPQFLEKALRAAAKSGAKFDVNAHWSLLPAPRAFIARCRKQREQPAFIEAFLSPRLLYAFLDIVRHAFGSLEAAPMTLQYERLLPDGSPDNLVDCRTAAGFPDGILTLLAMPGPVIWTGNYRRNVRSLATTVFAAEGLTRNQFFDQRIDAIAAAMASFGKHDNADHLREVSRAFAMRTTRALRKPTASDSRARAV
jgi:pyochelin biosynthesis protein PchG